MEALPYDRELLVSVLVYHQRTDTSGCHCGWARLGASHPEHVADVYERALNERCNDPHCQGCSNPGCVGHGLDRGRTAWHGRADVPNIAGAADGPDDR